MRPTLLIDDRMADVKNPFATRRGVRHRSGPFHLRKRTVERTGTWKTPHDLERCSALFTKRLQTEEYIDGGSYSEVPPRRNVTDLESVALRQRVPITYDAARPGLLSPR